LAIEKMKIEYCIMITDQGGIFGKV
jgi:hypothetical protein